MNFTKSTSYLRQWILFYHRFVSPSLNLLLGISSKCRFHPSCSLYSAEALQKHGFFHGSLLTLKRIARCHPGSPGGLDQVPEQITRFHLRKGRHGS